jgi:hypothetical protein
VQNIPKRTDDATRYTQYHILQLMTGHDFFRCAFGRGDSAEITAAMKRAWGDPEVKARVYAMLEAKCASTPTYREKVRSRPWAEEVFGA